MRSVGRGELKLVKVAKIIPRKEITRLAQMPLRSSKINTIREEDGSRIHTASQRSTVGLTIPGRDDTLPYTDAGEPFLRDTEEQRHSKNLDINQTINLDFANNIEISNELSAKFGGDEAACEIDVSSILDQTKDETANSQMRSSFQDRIAALKDQHNIHLEVKRTGSELAHSNGDAVIPYEYSSGLREQQRPMTSMDAPGYI